MVYLEDALKTLLSQAFKFETEQVSLLGSLGRILAGDIHSDIDMPPFDKSAVDGYACRLNEELQNVDSFPVSLRMVETISAGTVPQKAIMAGECSRIMTGAMVPEGANCVIMVEDTEMIAENLVMVLRKSQGNNICYRGEDIRSGKLVLTKGIQITPAQVAVMAGVGAISPLVAKLPRVGIISTGDELVEPGVIPGIARIRNSNGVQLEAQVTTVPAQPFSYGIVADDVAELHNIINHAMADNDVVLLTGGVSMGDFDFVPEVMQKAGIEILFKSIAIRPGKPTVFGRRNSTFIFGLPGNPVSSFVIFEMLVRPFLHRMMGSELKTLRLMLPMGTDHHLWKSDRKSLIPVIIRNGFVYPVEYHGSAHINAYTVANGIMELEIGVTTIKKGDQVNVRPL